MGHAASRFDIVRRYNPHVLATKTIRALDAKYPNETRDYIRGQAVLMYGDFLRRLQLQALIDGIEP